MSYITIILAIPIGFAIGWIIYDVIHNSRPRGSGFKEMYRHLEEMKRLDNETWKSKNDSPIR